MKNVRLAKYTSMNDMQMKGVNVFNSLSNRELNPIHTPLIICIDCWNFLFHSITLSLSLSPSLSYALLLFLCLYHLSNVIMLSLTKIQKLIAFMKRKRNMRY